MVFVLVRSGVKSMQDRGLVTEVVASLGGSDDDETPDAKAGTSHSLQMNNSFIS